MPTCTSALLTDNPCLSANVIDDHKRKALEIWFMANELSVNGGTNYTNVLASTLLADANTLGQNFTDEQIKQAELAVARNNAVAAGAAISSDIDTLMGSIAPLSKTNAKQLALMRLLLLCKLGAHRSPPA